MKGCARRSREGPRAAEGGPRAGPGPAGTRAETKRDARRPGRPAGAAPAPAVRSWQRPLPRARSAPNFSFTLSSLPSKKAGFWQRRGDTPSPPPRACRKEVGTPQSRLRNWVRTWELEAGGGSHLWPASLPTLTRVPPPTTKTPNTNNRFHTSGSANLRGEAWVRPGARTPGDWPESERWPHPLSKGVR
ncbi:Protein Bassoon [Manis pentadactyla]|nr:Protein Bassoon [Manis pentadactyla]